MILKNFHWFQMKAELAHATELPLVLLHKAMLDTEIREWWIRGRGRAEQWVPYKLEPDKETPAEPRRGTGLTGGWGGECWELSVPELSIGKWEIQQRPKDQRHDMCSLQRVFLCLYGSKHLGLLGRDGNGWDVPCPWRAHRLGAGRCIMSATMT